MPVGEQYASILRTEASAILGIVFVRMPPSRIARALSKKYPGSSELPRALAAKTERGAAYHLAWWVTRSIARGAVPRERVRATADALLTGSSL